MKKEHKKMNARLKKAWIEALRSGDYKQGIGALCREDPDGKVYWCCLGVLADIAVDGYWIASCPPGAYGTYWALQKPNSNVPIQTYTALFSPRTEGELMRKNDQYKWSFEEIADWIEVNL